MSGTVGITHARARFFFRLGTALAAMLLAGRPCVLALDPSLDVNQYAHRAWRNREGFAKGLIFVIAQTPDGYLWLGTEFGLLRFDGVRAIPFQLPGNQQLPSERITGLLVSRDGALWIGTAKGLARWNNGKLTQYGELAGQYVNKLLEDHEGTVWAGTNVLPAGRLCAIQNDAVHCGGGDGSLGPSVLNLYEDHKGNLWVAVNGGLWRWKPGLPEFHALPGQGGFVRSFVENEVGTLLLGCDKSIQQIVDGKIVPYPLPGNVPLSRYIQTMFRDRDGGLWIGTYGQGVVHVHHGQADVFGVPDGLSSDVVFSFLEDREGNVWVSTNVGLDCFRAFAVTTISKKQGLWDSTAASILADKDGSIWLGTFGGMNKWNHGQISTYGKEGKFNGDAPQSIFQDRDGRVWVSTLRGLGYLQNDRFIPLSDVPSGIVHSIAEDKSGNLWVANQQAGLLHLLRDGKVEQISWGGLGRKEYARTLAADPVHGGVWLGFVYGGIAYFVDGAVHESYSIANGLGRGFVEEVRLDPDGTLWVATEGGLSRLKNGRIATLDGKNGLPCDGVHWSFEDDDHSFWLYTKCGLVRVSRSELDAWSAAADKGESDKLTIHPMVLDDSDGLGSQSYATALVPQVTKTSDGKLWFVSYTGFGVIDPRHILVNKLPPPVHVQKVTADGKVYDSVSGLRLPPRVRDLTIDYTALSFAVPEKMHFRYKLEGQDPDWREVVNDRQVQYSNLAPRHYTFHVMASNNSGVWNETGASLDFSVLPAFYQTIWFRILCVFGFLVLLWSIYRLRIQEMQRQFNIALDARVNERTRIARELHDTLLQTFHGAMFQFQAARNLMSQRPEEALRSLDDAISETKKALGESREAIQDLRSEPIARGNLAEFLMSMSPELAGSHSDEQPPVFDLIEEGERQTLSSTASKEICRIALELIRNAYQHAQAQRIEAEIRYSESVFRLRIRDDGIGIEPRVLKEGGKLGHWGLRGVRERADRIGAQLDLWSEPGGGTEIQLLVPASIAYENGRDGYGAKLFRKVKSRVRRS